MSLGFNFPSLRVFMRHDDAKFVPACCLAGILGLWLGFPNDLAHVPFLIFLWPLAIAVLGLSSPGCMAAARRGWLASFPGCCCALYWLSFPVHYVGGLPWGAAAVCAVFIAACIASQGAIFAGFIFCLRGLPAWRIALLSGLVWYLLEYAYALCLGFPWLPLAGALAAQPLLIQAADTLGAYLLAGFWLCACLLCFLAFSAPAGGKNLKISRGSLAAGACLAGLLLAYGLWRLESVKFERDPSGPGTVAALFVEGNVDQNQKWVPAFQGQTLNLYLELTERGMAQVGEDGRQRLILWPETALPFFFEKMPAFAEKVRQCAIKADCPLLFGAPGIEKLPGRIEESIYNRAFLIGPDGKIIGRYDKEHLVPFGEYLPRWLNFAFLEALLQGVGIYEEGREAAPLRYDALALGMLICYEGIFPWLAQERVAHGANILVDISNDGWFGRSPAALQHLYLTSLRCVEQNRWLLRSTNTGISAIVDTRGRLAVTGPRFQAGFLWGSAYLEHEPSLYHKLAPWLPLAAIFAMLVLWAPCLGRIWAGRRQYFLLVP